MSPLVVSDIVKIVSGFVDGDVPRGSVGVVCTDTRAMEPDSLFFALPGENFDGHDFVAAALQQGALGAVVARDRAREMGLGTGDGRLIVVDSPLAALGRLAAAHRAQHRAHVVVVVGSNGKTTTKTMIGHVLSGELSGRCSPKSYNNAIGVPLTLLSAEGSDDFLVVEIGTNSPGEVLALTRLAAPDSAVVTSIGSEHLAGLGSLAGVVKEELSVLDGVKNGGFVAVNAERDDVRQRIGGRDLTVTTFGRRDDVDLRVSDVCSSSDGLSFRVNDRFDYSLPTVGEHNALNATGAIAIALRLGLSHEKIAERLSTAPTPPMRSEVVSVGTLTVLNDAYNANLDSALAAIDTLEKLDVSGQRIVVFGEMRELGGATRDHHEQVARRLCRGRISHVLLVGAARDHMAEEFARARDNGGLFVPRVSSCDDVASAAARLRDIVADGDGVLLKASRAEGLERVLDDLRSSGSRG